MSNGFCITFPGLMKVGIAVLGPLVVICLFTREGCAGECGVVSNVKVVSDKIEDVSSIDAWKASVLKPGMSDKEKALAVWRTVVRFRHQNAPPWEFLQTDDGGFCVHDPIKTFNVYGYGMCCCAASNIEALARAAGLRVRGRAIRQHSLPEILWDGRWHMLDASLINYFRDASGDVASIDEIMANVADWYKAHPESKGDDRKLRDFMRAGGWKNGPSILAATDFIDEDGWLPAGTHGWYAPMGEFDGSVNFPYEYGYSEGYRVNVALRPGEVLTRNWSNKGMHSSMDLGPDRAPGCLTGKVGEGDLCYAPAFGDIAPGRIGNGTLVYNVPLRDGAAALSALTWENIASAAGGGKAPAVHVKSPAAPGVIVIRMPSSYVYLSGALSANCVVGQGGSIRVSLSRNNGLDWQEIFASAEPGSREASVNLTPLVYRLYDYRLKLELAGAGTGLNVLRIEHDIQHSQRALPALGPYENKITFAAAPPEGTVTIEALAQPKSRGNQVSALDFHPVFDGVACTDKGFEVASDGGTVTYAVETPGDMARLRFGCFCTAATEADGWDFLVSFDAGKTWTKAGRASGAVPGVSEYVTFSDVPASARKALVRFAGGKAGSSTIVFFRIDADYREPSGGFRPVRITYVWNEENTEKRHVHVAASPEETYEIRCSDKPVLKPVMKSLTLELAD